MRERIRNKPQSVFGNQFQAIEGPEFTQSAGVGGTEQGNPAENPGRTANVIEKRLTGRETRLK